jgi:hypothetical protein
MPPPDPRRHPPSRHHPPQNNRQSVKSLAMARPLANASISITEISEDSEISENSHLSHQKHPQIHPSDYQPNTIHPNGSTPLAGAITWADVAHLRRARLILPHLTRGRIPWLLTHAPSGAFPRP